ncbi:F-actin capping protein alpha subunit [Hordeum vulgare]|nr:F-actin capping protein alpha subunit [Hordeum vulgare]
MSGAGGADEPLSGDQKREIAVWFLANAPADEIHYVAKGNRLLLRRSIPARLNPSQFLKLNGVNVTVSNTQT